MLSFLELEPHQCSRRVVSQYPHFRMRPPQYQYYKPTTYEYLYRPSYRAYYDRPVVAILEVRSWSERRMPRNSTNESGKQLEQERSSSSRAKTSGTSP
jgi:hypothetical protein